MCTDFLLIAQDTTVVNARSMEFGTDLASQILVGGNGTKKQSMAPDFKNGLAWKATHGYVGLNAAGLNAPNMITDGMNDAGLSIGGLWLPGTEFPSVTNSSQALSVDLFASWALGNYATVAEVQAALPGVQVWVAPALAHQLTIHFSIHDASGNSIVIEFIGGRPPMVHENPVGVLTNAPPFPWHLANIDNYVGLTNEDAKPIAIGSKRCKPAGLGSGMRGLPGDSTPPSRFIRTVFQKQFATAPADTPSACSLALHLLNGVDIPVGTSCGMVNKTLEYDYTQWAVIKSLTNKTISYRTYDNPTLCEIAFSELDLTTPGETLYDMPPVTSPVDVSKQLLA